MVPDVGAAPTPFALQANATTESAYPGMVQEQGNAPWSNAYQALALLLSYSCKVVLKWYQTKESNPN